MSLTAIRLITSSLLFVLTLFVGTVPVYLYQKWVRQRSQSERTERKSGGGRSPHEHLLSANFYVQAITQVGGGILFFTVLVHMIPEVRNNFEKYLKSNESVFHDETKEDSPKSIEDLSLPYLEIAICVGFFAVYLAEVLMHSLLDRKHDNNEVTRVLDDKSVSDGLNNNQKFESQSTVNNSSKDEEEYDETSAIISADTHRDTRKHSNREDEPVVIVIDHMCDEVQDSALQERLLIRFLHGLVIIASFSIHSLFDGISIGVRAESSEIWTMFIAIASHKLMIALIISVELWEKCQNFVLVVCHMILFSIMSPIGIITVMIAEKTLDTHSEVNPVVILLSAIASGTILYIVFFEILQKDRVSKLAPIMQFIAMFVGFGLMFMITITLSEE